METVSISRICWSYGFKSQSRAWQSIEEDISDGLVSWGERPNVKPYRNQDGDLRFAVYIDGMANDGFGY